MKKKLLFSLTALLALAGLAFATAVTVPSSLTKENGSDLAEIYMGLVQRHQKSNMNENDLKIVNDLYKVLDAASVEKAGTSQEAKDIRAAFTDNLTGDAKTSSTYGSGKISTILPLLTTGGNLYETAKTVKENYDATQSANKISPLWNSTTVTSGITLTSAAVYVTIRDAEAEWKNLQQPVNSTKKSAVLTKLSKSEDQVNAKLYQLNDYKTVATSKATTVVNNANAVNKNNYSTVQTQLNTWSPYFTELGITANVVALQAKITAAKDAHDFDEKVNTMVANFDALKNKFGDTPKIDFPTKFSYVSGYSDQDTDFAKLLKWYESYVEVSAKDPATVQKEFHNLYQAQVITAYTTLAKNMLDATKYLKQPYVSKYVPTSQIDNNNNTIVKQSKNYAKNTIRKATGDDVVNNLYNINKIKMQLDTANNDYKKYVSVYLNDAANSNLKILLDSAIVTYKEVQTAENLKNLKDTFAKYFMPYVELVGGVATLKVGDVPAYDKEGVYDIFSTYKNYINAIYTKTEDSESSIVGVNAAYPFEFATISKDIEDDEATEDVDETYDDPYDVVVPVSAEEKVAAGKALYEWITKTAKYPAALTQALRKATMPYLKDQVIAAYDSFVGNKYTNDIKLTTWETRLNNLNKIKVGLDSLKTYKKLEWLDSTKKTWAPSDSVYTWDWDSAKEVVIKTTAQTSMGKWISDNAADSLAKKYVNTDSLIAVANWIKTYADAKAKTPSLYAQVKAIVDAGNTVSAELLPTIQTALGTANKEALDFVENNATETYLKTVKDAIDLLKSVVEEAEIDEIPVNKISSFAYVYGNGDPNNKEITTAEEMPKSWKTALATVAKKKETTESNGVTTIKTVDAINSYIVVIGKSSNPLTATEEANILKHANVIFYDGTMTGTYKAGLINLNLTKPYYFDSDIDVDSVSLTRHKAIAGNKVCLYLPFDVNKANFKALAEKLNIYAIGGAYKNVDGGENVVSFGLINKGEEKDSALYAFKPYVVNAKAGTVDQVGVNNVQIKHTEAYPWDPADYITPVTVSVAGGKILFSFSSTTTGEVVNKGEYWLNTNKFLCVNFDGGQKVNPGMLKVVVSGSNVEYALQFGEEGDEATEIEAIEAQAPVVEGIYTVNGVKVNNMSKPGLYIVNGKKVMVK